MDRGLSIAGFIILSSMVLLLFGFTIYHAWILHSLGEVIVLAVMLGLIFEIYCEGRSVSAKVPDKDSLWSNAIIFLAVVCGAIITYTLKVNVGLGAVVAAGLVALIASFIIPVYGVPIYCGAFVGMTSSRLLINYTELSFAAIVAGILFLLTDRVFNGCGGKLGTIAFTGTLMTGFGLKKEFLITPVPEWDVIGLIILFSVIAAVTTFWLSVYLKHGGVAASGIVSITGGLILPAVYPDGVGSTLAVMVICASFAGMSSAKRFPSLFQMMFVGLVCGLIFIYSMPLAGGAGGKLGTIAFGSVLAVLGYIDLSKKLKLRFSNL